METAIAGDADISFRSTESVNAQKAQATLLSE
jgi:hypothetical protein